MNTEIYKIVQITKRIELPDTLHMVEDQEYTYAYTG